MMLTIWSFSFGGTFDAYLLELARVQGRDDPNEFVGSVETVRGMVALVMALPLGVLSDKMNRRRMLQGGSVVATAGVAILASGVASDSVPMIYAGVVVLALFMQVFMSCGNAFLADSVPKDQLTKAMAMQGSLFLIGYSVGPLAQMAVIAYTGDTWRLSQLHVFLCSGFALWPLVLPGFLLLEKTPSEREAELRRGLTSDVGGAGASASASPGGTAPAQAVALSASPADTWKLERVMGVRKKWFVPILIELCSLIIALGAGMTVKFFPLFFKEVYHFEPIALNGLSGSYTICIAIFVQLCRKASSKIGRCQAALLWQVCSVAALFALWLADPLPLVIFLYIIRGSFMNSLGPINSAIVLECVDSKYRGRWSALQSISRFSWSGSAVLGGWIADSHSYRYTFFITGLIYAVAAVLYVPLLLMVPKEQPASGSASSCSGEGRGAASAQDSEEGGKAHGESVVSLQPANCREAAAVVENRSRSDSLGTTAASTSLPSLTPLPSLSSSRRSGGDP
mmetsp:Transcript_40856/g.108006  ORF Transcript_40856/g.108006 Transcript_40856/m.108006 type:complete len:511 (-) Transcript_40856:72-1604(-)